MSADSASDAWAVGQYVNDKTSVTDTLILRWSGTGWSRAKSPSPSPYMNFLYGVSADSPTDAWAVGSEWKDLSGGVGTLILHWNGATWSKVQSPSPSPTANLTAVSADSPTDAWAVGNYTSGQNQAAVLILHWDGSTWSRATSPRVPSTFTELRGVSADSATDASAVGRYLNRNTGIIDTLALHWDGASWSKVHSPSPSMTNNALNAVSTLSPTDAWSAGAYNPTVDVIQTMTDYWNGTAWSKVTSPNPDSSDSELHGVSAYSPINAWAVGWYCGGCPMTGSTKTLILQWNVSTWSIVPSPNPDTIDNFLYGVSADSQTDAWAVGWYQKFGGNPTVATLILHWNGSSWTQA